MTPNQTELAWAAGFFDGEGCFFRFGGSPNHTSACMAAINQTDPRVLRRFCEAVFGVGQVRGPYERGNPKWSPVWRWQCRGLEDVQAVGAALWKYLSPIKRSAFSSVMAASVAASGHKPKRRRNANKKES